VLHRMTMIRRTLSDHFARDSQKREEICVLFLKCKKKNFQQLLGNMTDLSGLVRPLVSLSVAPTEAEALHTAHEHRKRCLCVNKRAICLCDDRQQTLQQPKSQLRTIPLQYPKICLSHARLSVPLLTLLRWRHHADISAFQARA
jgi:hypothetical protein